MGVGGGGGGGKEFSLLRYKHTQAFSLSLSNVALSIEKPWQPKAEKSVLHGQMSLYLLTQMSYDVFMLTYADEL